MADLGINATVAWLSTPDGDQVAGCAFLVRPDLAVTCAHVVREHLGLPETPEGAPQEAIRLNFPGNKEVDAHVADGGWWPDRRDEYELGALDDLAVLLMGEPQIEAPCISPTPRPPNEGEAFRCFAYPATHRDHGRDVLGEVRSELNARCRHQLDALAGRQNIAFIRRGFSGAPVFDEKGRSILGMVVAVDLDSDLIAYAIPAADLRRAMAAVDTARLGAASAKQRAREETSAAVAAETRVPAGTGVSDLAAEARGHAETLREQVERAANQMPSNFGARVVRSKLEALSAHFRRGRAEPLRLGVYAAFLVDLALAIDQMPADDRPELQALVPLAGDVLAALDEMSGTVPALGTESAPWPPGVAQDLLERLRQIEEGLDGVDPLGIEEVVDTASEHVLSLRGEAERERPDWSVVRHEAASLDRTLRGEADEGSTLRHVSRLATSLATILRETAGEVIRDLQPPSSFQELPDTPEMVVVPAGSFMMGSPEDDEDAHDNERPQHRVTFAGTFAIGRYPVTFDEYLAFCAATGRDPPPDSDWGRGRRPVISVFWNDAQDYCRWLAQRTGSPYRLPSEAEWEYACRADTHSPRWWGDEISPVRANYSVRFGRTTAVGQYPPNPWGLHDTLGNVWEWCADPWHENYRGAPESGSAWTGGGDERLRVLRGGSWYINPRFLRSAVRNWRGTGGRNGDVGFRVARTLR